MKRNHKKRFGAEAENIANDLEGQRVFGKEHYEFWLISTIASVLVFVSTIHRN